MNISENDLQIFSMNYEVQKYHTNWKQRVERMEQTTLPAKIARPSDPEVKEDKRKDGKIDLNSQQAIRVIRDEHTKKKSTGRMRLALSS